MHRNVAHDTVKRSADAVVSQLLFLGLAQRDRRLVVRLGIVECLLCLLKTSRLVIPASNSLRWRSISTVL